MGYKRKYTGTSARTRPYKKKKTSSSFVRSATGPQTLVRKLRYCTRKTIDGGAAGAATNLFIRANGCFDPEVAVGGHQPMGFDQYMALYDHFKVLKSTCTVTFLANATTGTPSANQVIGSIYLDDDAGAIISVEQMIEQGLSSWAVINSGQGVKPTTISKSFNPNTFFSNRKESSQMIGSAAADPVETVNFNISVAGLDIQDPAPASVLIVVDYIVSFSERKTLAQS